MIWDEIIFMKRLNFNWKQIGIVLCIFVLIGDVVYLMYRKENIQFKTQAKLEAKLTKIDIKLQSDLRLHILEDQRHNIWIGKDDPVIFAKDICPFYISHDIKNNNISMSNVFRISAEDVFNKMIHDSCNKVIRFRTDSPVFKLGNRFFNKYYILSFYFPEELRRRFVSNHQKIQVEIFYKSRFVKSLMLDYNKFEFIRGMAKIRISDDILSDFYNIGIHLNDPELEIFVKICCFEGAIKEFIKKF